MPEITVIMPIYNAQNYLNKSIHSILNQTFKDFELLLINDGSTDFSLFFCKSFEQKDNRIKVMNQNHGGLVAKRIEGVKAATGNYVVFVDQDDWVEPEYLEHMYSAAIENDADISMCRAIMELADGGHPMTIPIKSGTYRAESLESIKINVLFNHEICRNPFSLAPMWDKLIRREIMLNNLQYLDPRLKRGEEVIFSTSCILDSKTICIGESADYHYVKRPGTMTKTVHNDNDLQLRIFESTLQQTLSAHGYSSLIGRVGYATEFLHLIQKKLS